MRPQLNVNMWRIYPERSRGSTRVRSLTTILSEAESRVEGSKGNPSMRFACSALRPGSGPSP